MLSMKKVSVEDIRVGTKVIVAYAGKWFPAEIFCTDNFCVVDPEHKVINVEGTPGVELYLVCQEESNKLPQRFSVRWEAMYETDISLLPGEVLGEVIQDINTESDDTDTQYVTGSFKVLEITDSQGHTISKEAHLKP